MVSFKQVAGIAKHCRFWKRGHGSFLLDNIIYREKNSLGSYTDEDHLIAAAKWLEAAQDATPDGGVVGRYRLNIGWTSTYPETTGYIVPTFIALAARLNDQKFNVRAKRAIDFLLSVQLESGAFPGLEIAENSKDPSPFNTAQIINGLVAWAAATKDNTAAAAARKAGDWLLSIQDEDGAWRKHYYYGVAPTYSAHIACWLAQLGEFTGDRRYLDAASRNIEWVLGHRVAETGWIENMGFDADSHKARTAYTHTIAYTLWGILYTCEILKRQDGIDAVAAAASKIARRLELSRWLPGVLDWRWKGAADYACLTGNAQMALIWFKLYRRMGGAHFVNAAFKAIDLVKQCQPMQNPNPGIRGGIAGSHPVWGGYIFVGLPNWAAKYFADALMEKERILTLLPNRPQGTWALPSDVPQSLPPCEGNLKSKQPPKVAMLAGRGTKKVAQMCAAWAAWGFRPDLVIVEYDPVPSVAKRLWGVMEARGVGQLILRVFGQKPKVSAPELGQTSQKRYVDPETYCKQLGIACLVVDDVNGRTALSRLRESGIDLAVHAGAGIIRPALLDILPLGLVNAHMGLLPHYRGMNVSEWAAFNGAPVGCTVHLIDAGIDTGSILCAQIIDTTGIRNISELRTRVDDNQVLLLGKVLKYALSTGALPPVRPQGQDEGRQYFKMHRELAQLIYKTES